MQIKKRNGRIIEFDVNKIINAIEKAMQETLDGMDKKTSKRIADSIQKDLENIEDIPTVEIIQDMIEQKLMASNRKDVAKKFILYREYRNKNRNNRPLFKYLDDDFIANYKHKPSPMNPLGEFIYYRTYSRWLPEENRREYWWETVRRTVEFNCSIIPDTSVKEAQELFDNMYNLKQFLSGRTMWIGMTDVSKEYVTSNYNCGFTIIDDFKKFKELFYLLMVGTGVGFRILKRDVNKLPPIRTNFEIVHEPYQIKLKHQREDNTSIEFVKNVAIITIGDSKEGWTQSLDWFLTLLYENEYKNITNIIINYNNVRPKGEKLKRFGGTASGHESLKTMFDKISKILHKSHKEINSNIIKLKPIDCLDIANIIGENVVVGGVRRTAEVALLDPKDKESIEAKSGLYYQNENGEWLENKNISHRKMSNNSIFYEEKPTREQLHWQVKQMRYSGEPGFMNVKAAKLRREDCEGANPCFTGDMKLLTSDGYRTFEELENQEVNIININGNISKGKIWSSGIKDVIELTLNNGSIIKSTPNHIFKLLNGEECEAKNLKNKKIQSYCGINNEAVVISIKQIPNQKVYDFSEPLTNWGIVEGFIVHNCMEVLLRDRGLCNLTTNNVFSYVENGKLNKEALFYAQKLSARAGLRMTCLPLELHKWHNTQTDDRLLGCSLTGWQDAMNAINYTIEQQRNLLKQLNFITNNEAEEYAKELNIPTPKLVCTIKPEGTLSQLAGVSSGVHFSHSPYYLRRVRINANDPLVKVCEELKYPVFPENGQDINTCNTKVVEFPVKAPLGKTKYDVTAIEQLEIYKMFQEYYTDHNTSITIHVRNNEWEEVEEWMYNNWDNVVAVSFLSLDENFYPQAPYEAISEEEYNKRINEMKPFIPSLISKYEIIENEIDIGNSDCVNGVCPIR